MIALDPHQLAWVVGAVFVSGVLRGLTGFGFAVAAVPLLTFFLDPRAAVGLVILLQLAIGILDSPRAWGEAYRAPLRWLSLGALVGTPIGVALLGHLEPDAARLIGAAAAAIALVSVWRGPSQARGGQGIHPLALGLGAGLLNGVAAMPGPPVVAYLLNARAADDAGVRATLIVFFAGAAVLATASGALLGLLDRSVTGLAGVALAPLMIGTGLGAWLFRNAPSGLYRPAAMAVLAVSALAAGSQALVGLLDVS